MVLECCQIHSRISKNRKNPMSPVSKSHKDFIELLEIVRRGSEGSISESIPSMTTEASSRSLPESSVPESPVSVGFPPPTRRPTRSSFVRMLWNSNAATTSSLLVLITLQYDLTGIQWNKNDPKPPTWMYARDARSQQQGLPPARPKKYPGDFWNYEELLFSTPGLEKLHNDEVMKCWMHHPLIPGTPTTWTHESVLPRGAVRSVWTEGNPNIFEVAFHSNKEKPPNARFGPFQNAPCIPAVVPNTKAQKDIEQRSISTIDSTLNNRGHTRSR